MIHVFHGFLGSPADFFFIPGEVTCHDLYSADFNPQVSEEDTIIGYSLGGRIALEIAARLRVKKLILISAHPGLSSEVEKQTRRIWEDSILEKLQQLSREAFLSYWNSLEVFKNDLPLTNVSEVTYGKSADLFQRYRLSKQKNFLQEIEPFKSRVRWVIGLQDAKYLQLAREQLIPMGIDCHFMEGGHRLFQKHELLSYLDKEMNK